MQVEENSSRQDMTLPDSLRAMLATRTMRLFHFIWHDVRYSYLSLPPKDQEEIERLGWKPPRPALSQGGWPPLVHNRSGEDFLFSHRKMIRAVNAFLTDKKDSSYPKVVGWKNIPPPNDPEYPVPPPYSINDPKVDDYLVRVKSDAFYEEKIRVRDELFRNKDFLKTITLGELGAHLEFTLHNWAHMRWSSLPKQGFRPQLKAPYNADSIDPKWDSPDYDSIADPYASHMNPLFWKLHGYIDDRVNDWKEAHGLEKIDWIGTWEGPSIDGFSPQQHDHSIEQDELSLHQVLAILVRQEKCSHFYEKTLLLELPKQAAKFSSQMRI